MAKWALQDAKAHFSEVVRRANADGPQVMTYRGVEKAVVVSADEFVAFIPADGPSSTRCSRGQSSIIAR
jgi:antitoxin Phd